VGVRNRSRLRRQPREAGLFAMEFLERRQCLAVGVSVSLAEATVIEGESIVARLTLSEPLRTVERIFVSTQEGTATYGRDYFAPLSQQVVFMPGQTTSTVSITTLRDRINEGVETFTILATPVNTAIRPGSAEARIADFMPLPGVSVADVTVTEGNEGTATTAEFIVTLTTAYPKPVTVSYVTRDGTATVANNDYVAVSGTLTFAPGEISKVVGVTVNGDNRLEPDETFQLVLSAPVNAILDHTPATATIVNDEIDEPGFQIDLVFLTTAFGDVPETIRDLTAQAAARWSRIIIGDLPSVTTANGLFIDDLRFEIQMGVLGTAVNGPAGPLANAGPRQFRAGGAGLPYEAITGINPFFATFATAAQRAALLETLIHEIGHGLGFTDFASVFRQYIDQTTAVFTGPNALREYNSIFGTNAVGVPLEPVLLAHWDEATFQNEIMTPNSGPGRNLLSRITIGALEDIGYDVNYAAADRYLPPGRPRTASQSENEAGNIAAALHREVQPALTPRVEPVLIKPSAPPVPSGGFSSQPAVTVQPVSPPVITSESSGRLLPPRPGRSWTADRVAVIPEFVMIGPSRHHRLLDRQGLGEFAFAKLATGAALDAALTDAGVTEGTVARHRVSVA